MALDIPIYTSCFRLSQGRKLSAKPLKNQGDLRSEKKRAAVGGQGWGGKDRRQVRFVGSGATSKMEIGGVQ